MFDYWKQDPHLYDKTYLQRLNITGGDNTAPNSLIPNYSKRKEAGAYPVYNKKACGAHLCHRRVKAGGAHVSMVQAYLYGLNIPGGDNTAPYPPYPKLQ